MGPFSGKKLARVSQLSRVATLFQAASNCPVWRGIAVQFALDRVSSLPWNRCSVCRGLGVQVGAENAARVHLAVPEQSLFKKNTTKSKASVTLVMKPGHVLATEQIVGIQRLVAASVPDIVSGDVTILDQHGIAVTRVVSPELGMDNAGTQLDSKKSTEDYLTRKVMQVLDRAFGPGEAIATVDVSLNLDQSRVTTEEVVPAKAKTGQEGGSTGVVVRERQTLKDAPAGQSTSARDAQTSVVTSTESDYQVGRRVEQTVSAPGTTRRMTIAVVVKKPMSEAQLEKLKEVVGLAIGFNAERGDAIVVSSMNRLTAPDTMATDAATASDAAASIAATDSAHGTSSIRSGIVSNAHMSLRAILIFALLFVAAMALGIFLLLGKREQNKRAARQLANASRDQVLKDVRQWIQGPVQAETTSGVYK